MKLDPVKSSQISGMGYVEESRLLRIQFRGDTSKTYEYQNVTPEIYQAMLKAESLGKFFASTIRANKKAFPFRVIDAEI